MSAVGQTRKSAHLNGMSVLPTTADVVGPPRNVRVVPASSGLYAGSFVQAVAYGRVQLRNGLEIDPSGQAAVQKNWVIYHARFARSKIVVAGPPADECCSMNRSSSPLITNERLLFLPSQFGNVARSI
jgi:hypothetical protein